MKKHWIITLLIGALLFTFSCENTNSAQNSNNTKQNENTSTEIKPNEPSIERQIKIKSENSFDETYAALKKAIESKKMLTIIAELDHSANAKKVEIELRQTKVIMFGNPALGTPLMKENQEIGIDLPQKMLVYEDENGDVYIVYNDPKVLAENHGIKDQGEITLKISEALKSLSEAAAKKAAK
jgi:uncharacterized protein (DUF302 family)